MFDTGLIAWGLGIAGDDTVQLCFVKSGFRSHEVHIPNDAPAHTTNGTKQMNVTLVPE